MLKNKVKVSNIVSNQLPQFVQESYPLVSEFFKEYYKSQEIPGSSLDLLNNIDQYVKLDNIANITEETTLSENVDIFDEVIYVNSVAGFSERYGLIQIDDEIITYEYADPTNNSFVGCIRGFSGIEDFNSEKQLVFVTSLSDSHQKEVIINGVTQNNPVRNLNVLFLKEFLTKIKTQFSPGFENREFYKDDSELNQSIFIKQSSDFYSSKGTDDSFEILFKALYGENATILKPRDFLIEPSSAQYRVTKDLVVEAISGDPLQLVNRTLFQDETFYPQAYGSVTNVEKITRNQKDYYIISLDYDFDKDINVSGSIFGNFPIHPKTLCTDFIAQNSTTISVDSTVGFPNTGELVVDFEDGEQIIITYESKSLNQFYDCSLISRDIPLGTEINFNTNAYSYTNKERTEKITVRITGVLGNINEIENDNELYEVGDTGRIYSYGVKDTSVKFNNWIYNIPVTYNIYPEDLVPQGFSNGYKYEIFTKDENNIYDNEKVELDFLFKDVSGSNIRSKKIFDVKTGSIPKKSIQVTNDKEIVEVFSLRKLITKVRDFDITANIQNTYKDKGGDLYVAAPSLPNYFDETLKINDRSVTLNGVFSTVENYDANIQNSGDSSGELIIFRTKTGSLKKHGFITGDAIVYIPGTGANKLTIQDVGDNVQNVYFVKKIDNNSIKLSLSRENIDGEKFLKISGTLSDDQNKFVPYNFCSDNLNQKQIGTQKLIRTIQKISENDKKEETTYGALGILVNGVELLNYKSEDVIYSGKINDINVVYGGEDYDVINPPILEVSDPKEEIGSKVTGLVSVNGSLKQIQVIDGGFGYIEEPKISITGGGGYGAQAKANLVSFDHVLEFNTFPNEDIVLGSNIIKFLKDHNFYTGEKVLYDSNGESNVGALVSGQYYYVSVVNSKQIKLHQSYDDSINGVNSKTLTYSSGIHYIKAVVQKKKIGSITILNEGTNYRNNERNVTPSDISLVDNTIFCIKHNYNSGDIIKYYSSDNSVGGLVDQKSYYVTKVDENSFKLSEVYTDENNKDFLYKTNQYITFTSIGTGTHTFNYEPISVSAIGAVGLSTISNQSFSAEIRPIFRGSITSISITNNGFGYGSEDIINYNKQPSYRLISGSNARVKPFIVDGKIKSVLIENAGSGYNSVPKVEVIGSGVGCVLLPILNTNGTISEVRVLNEGINYGRDTRINITNSGKDCKLLFKIQSWTINLVNRLIFNNQITEDDSILSRPLFSQNDLQYTHAYAPRKLRSYVYSKKIEGEEIRYRTDIENDNQTTNYYHSPIIGWSYDGCPIYGPYGYESPSGANGGKVIQLRSGYNGYDDDVLIQKSNRPNVNIFPLGFFVEDYDFIGNGDLDEFNGRFCKTPEFPNGVYAYFMTVSDTLSNTSGFIGSKKPIFPYVIGNYFKFKPVQFNFNSSSNQDLIKIEETEWQRNTTFYNIDSEYSDYDFIFNSNNIKNQFIDVTAVKSGAIDNIKVSIAGTDYKIGDAVIFDEENKSKLYADVSSLIGKSVTKIESNAFSISNVEFITLPDANKVLAICPTPHNLLNGDKIFINNLNRSVSFKGSYEITKLQNNLVLLDNVSTASTTGIVTYFNVFGNLDFPRIKENDVYTIGNEKIKILSIDKPNSRIKVEREYEDTTSTSHLESTVLFEESRKVFFNTESNLNFGNDLSEELYFDPTESFGVGIGTTTLFLGLETYNTKVSVTSGTQTILYFENTNDILKYNSGYVNIVNSTNALFNADKKKIVSIGSTSITIDFDTSLYSGVGVTCYLNKWNSVDIPTNSIYLPNHKFNSGDSLLYNANSGSNFTVFNGIDYFTLENNTTLYTAKISNDLIGISTNKVGLGTEGTFVGIGTTTGLLHFITYGSGKKHSFKTINDNILVGNIVSNKSTVYTSQNHGLQVNDQVTVTCLPEEENIISIKYNENLNRLLVDKKVVTSTNVDTDNDIIQIERHGYFTGQKVVYEEDDSFIDGLENEKIYYVRVVDLDRFNLCSSYYNSTLKKPITVGITSIINNQLNGLLYKVNPELNFVKNNKITFDVSDQTLSYFNGIDFNPAFDFKFFNDSEFLYEYLGDVTEENNFEIKKYGQIGISSGAKIEIYTKNVDSDSLYYKLVPTQNSPKKVIDDKENIKNSNKINFVRSSFDGKYSIVGIGSSKEFSISLNKTPETDQYLTGISYVTNSKTSSGPIDKISIKLGGSNLKKLPTIEGVSSVNGSNCVLYPESKSIGKILSQKITDIGFGYSLDKSITPKIKFPSILKIEPLSSLDKIDVTFVGNNYSTAPQLLVMDSYTNKIVDDIVLEYDIESKKVLILQNTKGIYNVTPKIIVTNNSNGISIISLEYNSELKTITATLNSYFDSIDSYPFSIGDKIIVEGVRTLGDGTGYNSQDHNYSTFTVTKLENLFGAPTSTVEYSFDGFGNPGTFDPECTSASIILESDLPSFSVKLKKNNYLLGEFIKINGIVAGKVESWDPNNELLKIETSKEIEIGDLANGSVSGTIGRVSNILSSNSSINISSSSVVNKGWNDQKGVLSSSLQRLHDSDYYQYFSYSIQSRVPFDQWDDSVNALNHTAGFKKFSDLNVESFQNNAGISTDQNLGISEKVVDVSEVVNLNCVNDFDLVFENNYLLNDVLSSDQIYFNSKELQDYSESRGNRVLLMDDISYLFNSDEREERYATVDKYLTQTSNLKKYIFFIRDRQLTFDRQSNIVTLLQDGQNIFLNQYANIWSNKELGSFDVDFVSNATEIRFYPVNYEFNDYDITYVNYGFDKQLAGIGSTSFGDVAQFIGDEKLIVGTSPTNIIGISTEYRVLKILVEMESSENVIQYDELTILNYGSGIEMLQYGNLSNNAVGLGTYNSYISNDEIKVDFIPNNYIGTSITSRSSIISISNSNYFEEGEQLLITSTVSSNVASISSAPSPVLNNISEYSDDHSAAYYIVSIEDTTNNRYQVSEILLVDDETECYFVEYGGLYTDQILGTFNAVVLSESVALQFEPIPDIDVQIRIFQTALRLPNRFVTTPSIIV